MHLRAFVSPKLAVASLVVISAMLHGCAKKSASGGGDAGPPDKVAGDPETPPDERQNKPPKPGTPDSAPATPTPRPADPRTTAYCEQDWQKYVTNHVVGLVKAYERTTRSTGVIATDSARVWQETVTAVSADAITFARVERALRPSAGEERRSTRTIPKAERFNDCLGLATTTDPTVITELLESRDEEVSIPAGTFPAAYVKNRETGTEDDRPYEHISEVWTIKGDLEIVGKAVTVWKTTKNGEPFEETATMTLTELRYP